MKSLNNLKSCQEIEQILDKEVHMRKLSERRWAFLTAVASSVTQTSGIIAVMYFIKGDVLSKINGSNLFGWEFWVTLATFAVTDRKSVV